MTEARGRVAAQFAANLRARRMRAGLTQAALADRALLKRSALGAIERGERTPRIDMLVVLASCLGVVPGELLRGIEWNRPQVSESSRLAGGEPRARAEGFRVTRQAEPPS